MSARSRHGDSREGRSAQDNAVDWVAHTSPVVTCALPRCLDAGSCSNSMSAAHPVSSHVASGVVNSPKFQKRFRMDPAMLQPNKRLCARKYDVCSYARICFDCDVLECPLTLLHPYPTHRMGPPIESRISRLNPDFAASFLRSSSPEGLDPDLNLWCGFPCRSTSPTPRRQCPATGTKYDKPWAIATAAKMNSL